MPRRLRVGKLPNTGRREHVPFISLQLAPLDDSNSSRASGQHSAADTTGAAGLTISAMAAAAQAGRTAHAAGRDAGDCIDSARQSGSTAHARRRRAVIPSFDLIDGSDESELEEGDGNGPNPPTSAATGAPAPAPAPAPALSVGTPGGRKRRITIPSFDLDDSSDDSGEDSTEDVRHDMNDQGQSLPSQARTLRQSTDASAHGGAAATRRKCPGGGEGAVQAAAEMAACPICNAQIAITELPYHVEEELAALCMPADADGGRDTGVRGRAPDEGDGVVGRRGDDDMGWCRATFAPHAQDAFTATSSLRTPSAVSRGRNVRGAPVQHRAGGHDVGALKLKPKGPNAAPDHCLDGCSAGSRCAGQVVHTPAHVDHAVRMAASGSGQRSSSGGSIATCSSASILNNSVDAAHFYSAPSPLPHFPAPRAPLLHVGGSGAAAARDCKASQREARGSSDAEGKQVMLPGVGEGSEAGAEGQKRWAMKDLRSLRWSNIWSRLDAPRSKPTPRVPPAACPRGASNAATQGPCRDSPRAHGRDARGKAGAGQRKDGIQAHHPGAAGTGETGGKSRLAAWVRDLDSMPAGTGETGGKARVRDLDSMPCLSRCALALACAGA